jgi:hypothetical protein
MVEPVLSTRYVVNKLSLTNARAGVIPKPMSNAAAVVDKKSLFSTIFLGAYLGCDVPCGSLWIKMDDTLSNLTNHFSQNSLSILKGRLNTGPPLSIG